jgi:polysaccharide pyruvyl transferase WcaK-like protein
VKTPPKRIGLFGLFGCGNSGNDGSLEAMLTLLQGLRPDANLTCICPVPDKVREDYRVLALLDRPSSNDFSWFFRILNRRLRILGWIYTFREVRKLDLLIVPGTGILDDYQTGPWGIPYVLFRWCLSAKLSGTEVWFVSIGAGPIHHPLSRWLMKRAAAIAQYRSYRDSVSRQFMMSVGFDARKDPVYPDLAFKLPAPKFLTPRRVNGEALTVALGIMSYGGWRHDHDHGTDIFVGYLQKVARFLTWLLDHGHNVRILTGDTGDQHAVQELLSAVAAEGRIVPPERLVAEPTLSLHDLMKQIASTDIVVATRFHNLVCALKLGRPTISIGYANKNDALLTEMGLGDFCQYIESLDVDLLIRQFITLADKREEHEQRIREVNRAYQQRLAHQDALLASKLSPPSEASTMILSDPRAALSPKTGIVSRES